jgi:hypothetical protein
MKDRTVFLFAGVIFVLWSLGFASGSVSLGSFTSLNSHGSYLLYNPMLELLSVAFAAVGIYFVYRAGREAQSPITQT